jgi:hypothetical protein
MPLDLVVNNGLKIRLATAGSIPGPVSAPEEGENFAHELIELEPRPVSSISLHHRPNAADQIPGAIRRVANLFERRLYLLDIRRRAPEPARGRIGARDDARQRLIHLVRDRGRQYIHGHQSRLAFPALRSTTKRASRA